MTIVDKLLASRPQLKSLFERRAADPVVSGDMLMKEMQAAGIPAKRTAVFQWRQSFRTAKRHRPNSLKGRVASALLNSKPEQLQKLKLSSVDTTAAVFKLGRSRLYKIANTLGLRPRAQPATTAQRP